MSKYRIMIVDDDEDVRRMLSMVLSTRFEVVEAGDGLDALSKLELYEPDFAIIDIMMPLMDGYRVCEAIRKHPQFKNMQVMFLSAYGTKENVKKSYQVGANLFMTKPIQPERILKNLEFTVSHEPPPLRYKKHSMEQLRVMDEQSKVGDRQPLKPPPPPHREPPGTGAASPSPGFQARTSEPQRATEARPSPPGEESAPPPDFIASGESKPRVLAVDDDTELLQMLDMALRDEYEVLTAENGMEAIERIVQYEPDLMLLDIMMPKMNGYQLLQSIRRNAFLRNLPVVVISAKSTPKDREYAARLGATHFIAKPYPIQDLLNVLARIAKTPGFQVKPKRLSLFEIKQHNFEADRDREEMEFIKARNRQKAELQSVIDKNRDKPPTKSV